MCGEQGFIAVHETVHLVKFIGKGCSIFFRVLMLRYLVLKDISTKVFVPDSYGLPGRTTTEQLYNFRVVLMLVCFSTYIFCHWPAISTSKLDFLFSNFSFGVLHSQ